MKNNIWVLVKVNSVWRIVFSLKSRGTGLVINLGFGVYRKVPFPAMISLECQSHGSWVLHSKDSPSALPNLYSFTSFYPERDNCPWRKRGVGGVSDSDHTVARDQDQAPSP